MFIWKYQKNNFRNSSSDPIHWFRKKELFVLFFGSESDDRFYLNF